MSRDYEKMMEDIDRENRITDAIYLYNYRQSEIHDVPLFAKGDRGDAGRGLRKPKKYKTRKKKSR